METSGTVSRWTAYKRWVGCIGCDTSVRFIIGAVMGHAMDIPAVFAVDRGPEEELGVLPVDGYSALPAGDAACGFREATSRIPRGETRGAVAVVDWTSLRRRSFSEGVVKRMRVRGLDTWFMTCVSDADDLMDAFNTTADVVLGPVHLVDGDGALADILSVSDSFIPAVMIEKGMPREGDGRDLWEELARLERVGFYRMCVIDSDGSIGDGTWEDLYDSYPSAVPFVPSFSEASPFGFRDRITPLELRAGPIRRPRRPPGSLRIRSDRYRISPAVPATTFRASPRTP